MQLAFSNEETSKLLVNSGKGPTLIPTAAAHIKKIDCSDRVKETLFQLLNNIATNDWDSHDAIVEAEVISHAIATLKSVKTVESLKRAVVNFVYSLTFSVIGRDALLENDAVGALVPIVKVSRSTINSMCATLAISNLVGGRQRTPMLAGCSVPENVPPCTSSRFKRLPSPEDNRVPAQHSLPDKPATTPEFSRHQASPCRGTQQQPAPRERLTTATPLTSPIPHHHHHHLHCRACQAARASSPPRPALAAPHR